jgi:DNA-binding response OmpR family regulator
MPEFPLQYAIEGTAPMGRKKILIADDNADIRNALAYILEDDGYDILTARNGAEALRVVREAHPDLVFLDVMMPEINGYDVCRTIKGDAELRAAYIIMLTASGQMAEQKQGIEAGADAYVVKPFSPLELLTRVRSILPR